MTNMTTNQKRRLSVLLGLLGILISIVLIAQGTGLL
jgi:hypothetical protein